MEDVYNLRTLAANVSGKNRITGASNSLARPSSALRLSACTPKTCAKLSGDALLLRELGFFAHSSPGFLHAVSKRFKTLKNLKNGTVLFLEGDDGLGSTGNNTDSLYLVKKGHVRLVSSHEDFEIEVGRDSFFGMTVFSTSFQSTSKNLNYWTAARHAAGRTRRKVQTPSTFITAGRILYAYHVCSSRSSILERHFRRPLGVQILIGDGLQNVAAWGGMSEGVPEGFSQSPPLVPIPKGSLTSHASRIHPAPATSSAGLSGSKFFEVVPSEVEKTAIFGEFRLLGLTEKQMATAVVVSKDGESTSTGSCTLKVLERELFFRTLLHFPQEAMRISLIAQGIVNGVNTSNGGNNGGAVSGTTSGDQLLRDQLLINKIMMQNHDSVPRSNLGKTKGSDANANKQMKLLSEKTNQSPQATKGGLCAPSPPKKRKSHHGLQQSDRSSTHSMSGWTHGSYSERTSVTSTNGFGSLNTSKNFNESPRLLSTRKSEAAGTGVGIAGTTCGSTGSKGSSSSPARKSLKLHQQQVAPLTMGNLNRLLGVTGSGRAVNARGSAISATTTETRKQEGGNGANKVMVDGHHGRGEIIDVGCTKSMDSPSLGRPMATSDTLEQGETSSSAAQSQHNHQIVEPQTLTLNLQPRRASVLLKKRDSVSDLGAISETKVLLTAEEEVGTEEASSPSNIPQFARRKTIGRDRRKSEFITIDEDETLSRSGSILGEQVGVGPTTATLGINGFMSSQVTNAHRFSVLNPANTNGSAPLEILEKAGERETKTTSTSTTAAAPGPRPSMPRASFRLNVPSTLLIPQEKKSKSNSCRGSVVREQLLVPSFPRSCARNSIMGPISALQLMGGGNPGNSVTGGFTPGMSRVLESQTAADWGSTMVGSASQRSHMNSSVESERAAHSLSAKLRVLMNREVASGKIYFKEKEFHYRNGGFGGRPAMVPVSNWHYWSSSSFAQTIPESYDLFRNFRGDLMWAATTTTTANGMNANASAPRVLLPGGGGATTTAYAYPDSRHLIPNLDPEEDEDEREERRELLLEFIEQILGENENERKSVAEPASRAAKTNLLSQLEKRVAEKYKPASSNPAGNHHEGDEVLGKQLLKTTTGTSTGVISGTNSPSPRKLRSIGMLTQKSPPPPPAVEDFVARTSVELMAVTGTGGTTSEFVHKTLLQSISGDEGGPLKVSAEASPESRSKHAQRKKVYAGKSEEYWKSVL